MVTKPQRFILCFERTNAKDGSEDRSLSAAIRQLLLRALAENEKTA